MHKILQTMDKYLNSITMYKLLVYGLGTLIAGATILNLTGKLYVSGPAIIASLTVLLISCYIANKCLAILWGSGSNAESWLITALILCCILPPETSFHGLALISLGGLLAMASKYLLTYHHKHLFNPAAFAALILGLTKLLPAIWWIGNPSILVLTAILGILILRKLRRFQLFFSFLIASMVVSLLVGSRNSQTVSYIILTAFKSGPLIFLGSVMLTEPETMPPRIWQQRIYGALVGAIFASQLRLEFVSATPELALVLGNAYSFFVSPKYKLRLHFKAKQELAPQIYDFSFISDSPIGFKPGQYLEWTLPHTGTDSRGNRRTFSIASAAGESELHIAIKSFEPGSSFKKALFELEAGQSVIVGQLSGNFLLPEDTHQKLVFIAGGIGITPFLSMIKTMLKKDERRDIVLFYLVSKQTDYCYQEIWQRASILGVRVIPVLTSGQPSSDWLGLSGYLTENMLHQEVSDYNQRKYYLSGPNALVNNYSNLLRRLRIKHKRIVTDYFSGY
jgi:ferredoxin-NADP reductase